MLEKKEHPARRLSIPGMLKVLMYPLIRFKKTGDYDIFDHTKMQKTIQR
jgi:hypothetical protein